MLGLDGAQGVHPPSVTRFKFKTYVCNYGPVAPTSCSVAMTIGQLWLLAKPSEELSACMGSRLFITGGLVGDLFRFVVVIVVFVFTQGI